MDLLQKTRNKLFWINDFINKGSIKNNVNDIRNILENFPSNDSAERRHELLANVLEHAISTVPYYEKYHSDNVLSDFPVVNKNIIRDNAESFKSRVFNEQNTFKVTTSGSTGTPFVAFQNKGKKLRNTADTIYFADKANFNIGNQLIYIRKWNSVLHKSGLLAALQNIKMVDVTDLSEEYIDQLIRSMEEDKSEKAILGYVSALTQICKRLDKTHSPPLNCHVKSILAIAENLSEYCKQSLEKYFQTPVLSRYSNMENGILAQQIPGNNNSFYINWASYVIEILDEEQDIPVKNGVLGRIVITDLFNYAMPMVRYDTGDLGVMGTDEHGIPVLKAVHGRKMDIIYDTKGNVVPPSVVFDLKFYEKIKQFQLIQNGEKSYTFRLNVEDNFNSAKDIIQKYQSHFGDDAEIIIEEINDIPILASGKRRLVINNFK